ncbi:hypothetical protein K439DRAFT_1632852 [Ramaria rubella]|nr:hypothetical protein K439DRAFT_1632852 [Ramaria rubella]
MADNLKAEWIRFLKCSRERMRIDNNCALIFQRDPHLFHATIETRSGSPFFKFTTLASVSFFLILRLPIVFPCSCRISPSTVSLCFSLSLSPLFLSAASAYPPFIQQMQIFVANKIALLLIVPLLSMHASHQLDPIAPPHL